MPHADSCLFGILSEGLISINLLKRIFGIADWLFFDGSKRAECRSTHRS